ncbi:MAG: putative protein-disulfide isomerase, partial [Paucimonas sp.]|nr:putative protein-disulfide isomerase [Paucimonas sp.]
MPSILYVSDPLCAWCYAQGPQLRPLLEGLPELTVEVVAGGLRPYRREAPDSSVRDALTSQLLHVREKSGLPVHESLLSGEYLAGDSEPACRAVVAARRLSASAALPVFD